MQILTKLQRFSFSAKVYNNFLNGQFVPSQASQFYEVRNPVTQEHVGRVPQSSQEEFNAVVASAKEAYRTWSKVPLLSNPRFIQHGSDTCSTWLQSSDATTKS